MPLELMKGIRHFQNYAFLTKKNLFDMLIKKGQDPKILIVACSDSRVVPTVFTHSEPGDLFQIRLAGNIISPYPSTSLGDTATIVYALDVLKVKEIIICGHNDCGAMKGLLTPNLDESLPAVASWLTYGPTLNELQEKYPDFEENPSLKLIRATKENILKQMKHLQSYPVIQEKLKHKELKIHGWFYEIESGEVLMYSSTCKEFISFEETITELFQSESVLKKMHSIVEEEAMNYLASQVSPKTIETYQQLMSVFNQLSLKGVNIIWEPIKEKITARLWEEFGALCEPRKAGIDPRFTALVEKGREIKLQNLKSFQKDILDSCGYRRFCSQMIRTLFTIPAPEERNVLTMSPHFSLR